MTHPAAPLPVRLNTTVSDESNGPERGVLFWIPPLVPISAQELPPCLPCLLCHMAACDHNVSLVSLVPSSSSRSILGPVAAAACNRRSDYSSAPVSSESIQHSECLLYETHRQKVSCTSEIWIYKHPARGTAHLSSEWTPNALKEVFKQLITKKYIVRLSWTAVTFRVFDALEKKAYFPRHSWEFCNWGGSLKIIWFDELFFISFLCLSYCFLLRFVLCVCLDACLSVACLFVFMFSWRTARVLYIFVKGILFFL